MQDETLRVEASSRGWRRFYAGFITLLLVFAVVTFAVPDVAWYSRAISVIVLIGQLPLAVGRFAHTEITPEGLDLDARVRRRRIPWAQVQEIELGGPYGRPPRLLLTDGTEVKSHALGGFMVGPEAEPRVLERLKQAAETHEFILKAR